MSFKLKPLSDYDRFVSVDIGANRVKVLVCCVEGGDLKILGKATTRQSKKNVIEGEIADLAAVSETVKRTILKAAEKLDSLPEEIVLSVNSSALLFDSVATNYLREHPESPIAMDEIDAMIASTEGKSLERIKAKAEDRFGLGQSELRLVTTSLSSITLDGKKVSNPIGFCAKSVKLTVLNFFVPSSTFQALASIVRDLSMKLLSVVPVSVALPKLSEEMPESFDDNAYVDFGYSKTTVVLTSRSELLGSAVLDFGFSSLEDLLKRNREGLSGIEIESRLSEPERFEEDSKAEFDAFYGLLCDGVRVAVDEVSPGFKPRNFFFSGGGSGGFFRSDFARRFDPGHSVTVDPAPLPPSVDAAYSVAYATALCAKEFSSQRKDPIAKILRYVIYRYE